LGDADSVGIWESELLEIRDRGSVVEQRLAEVKSEIAQLEAVRTKLLELKRRNVVCLGAKAMDWSCAIGVRKGNENDGVSTLRMYLWLLS
jgi:hypothetical protein